MFSGQQRAYRLAIESEVLKFESLIDLRNDLQLTVLASFIARCSTHLDPITADFFGLGATRISLSQELAQVCAVRRNRYQPYAHGRHERPVFPYEPKFPHGFAHRIRNAYRLVERAGFERNTKLVTSQAHQGVAAAHAREHECGELF